MHCFQGNTNKSKSFGHLNRVIQAKTPESVGRKPQFEFLIVIFWKICGSNGRANQSSTGKAEAGKFEEFIS